MSGSGGSGSGGFESEGLVLEGLGLSVWVWVCRVCCFWRVWVWTVSVLKLLHCTAKLPELVLRELV